MKTIEQLLAENEALKSQLKQKDEKIQSLEKLNDWYIEQLKLKLKEKFGASSEKADPNQLSLFDLFNEAESLMQPITTEPELETVIKPAEAYILEHVTHIYSWRNCDKNGEAGFVKSAEHPNALIAKSFVSASMMVHIMNNKYTLAL